jgi:hypothetical protein
MQPGAWLASLGLAVPPTSRRSLASCGRPLAVVAVLTVGATVFSAAAALLGSRQSAAVFHATAEGIGGQGGHPALHALPAPAPSGHSAAAVDDALASLKGAPFGLAFEPRALASLASASTEGGVDPPRPGLLIDTDLPPLRVDIMGLDHLPRLWPPAARMKRP